MGLTISAIIMSMPFDSCLAMQVCQKRIEAPSWCRSSYSHSMIWPVTFKAYLVLVAGTLAVLGDGFQRLLHQVHVALINVKSQQPEASGGASADAIQELQSLTH